MELDPLFKGAYPKSNSFLGENQIGSEEQLIFFYELFQTLCNIFQLMIQYRMPKKDENFNKMVSGFEKICSVDEEQTGNNKDDKRNVPYCENAMEGPL